VAEVQLPQLGESVTEGVITAWLVEVGDTVEVDQPIVEISTDKVDTEIPSPVAGTVAELKAEVDDTVEVGQVIAVIGDADEASSDDTDDSDDAGDDTDTGDDAEAEATDGEADADGDGDGGGDGDDQDTDAAEDDDGAQKEAAADDTTDDETRTAASGDGDRPSVGKGVLTSPLVRRLLRDAGLSEEDVEASGPGGRITREDAERAIADAGERAAEPAGAGAEGQEAGAAQTAGAGREAAGGTQQVADVTPPPAHAGPGDRTRPPASPTVIDYAGERTVTQDLTRVRKAIARSMMESLSTTAQLTAAVEVDMTAIMNLRAARKDAFRSQEGVGLSPLPIIARAVCMVLPRHPVVNSSMDLDDGTATFHRYVNLGMAVDTDRGLLVPNIKDAQDLTIPGIARAIADLAKRARDKKLTPDEISGGTFTITNTGSVGTLFDTPILNPPEVAILATAAIEKRPVVVSDAYGDSIAIRWMTYLCMSYDHRMLDGADAARFLQDLKYVLETHDFGPELGV
jgi:pyruvate dehydrogenase E2 component (dihydrolipoamide acetyltransferase)